MLFDGGTERVLRKRLGRPLPNADFTTKPKKAEKPKEVRCGYYSKDAEFKANILRKIDSINQFFFRTDTITEQEELSLDQAKDIKFENTGELMYAARVETTTIGQVKLYQHKGKCLQRCKIIDLFNYHYRDRLWFRANIFLIDSGQFHRTNIENLFDFPQTIRYCQLIEPSVKPCSIYFGKSVPIDFYDKEIDDYFLDITKNLHKEEVIVKVLGYESDIYLIDIIRKGYSIVEHLKSKFKLKFEAVFEDNENIIGDPVLLAQNRKYFKNKIRFGHPTLDRFSKTKMYNDQRNPHKVYYGAMDYFFKQLSTIESNLDDYSEPFFRNRLFRVRLINWSHIDSIYLIPDDEEYINGHADFCRKLEKDMQKDSKKQTKEVNLFKEGDKCLFRYDGNPKFGTWLRGVVVKVPKVNPASLIHFEDSPDNCEYRRGETEKLRSEYNITEYLPYSDQFCEVRSVDYGFRCVRLPWNMKKVSTDQYITKTGPWAIRCRLFGVKPFPSADIGNKDNFSDACLDKLDIWVRERMHNQDYISTYYVLFRSFLHKQQWSFNEPEINITLFHRFVPPYKLIDNILPRHIKVKKYRFDCINTELVKGGFASDRTDTPNERSNIRYDHRLINMLLHLNLMK